LGCIMNRTTRNGLIILVIVSMVLVAGAGLTWREYNTDIKVVGRVDAVCKDNNGIWVSLRVVDSSYSSIVVPNSYIKLIFNGTGPVDDWRAARLHIGDLIQFTVRYTPKYFDENSNWMISDLSWTPPCTDC